MAKDQSPPETSRAAKAERSFWLPFILIALISGATGALMTWLWLQPRLQAAAAGANPPTGPDEGGSIPPPGLTAGLPPAESDLILGNFYYDHSDWAHAIRHYESAIHRGMDNADIRTDLGNAYQFFNRPDDALAQYRAAQSLDPQHESSFFNQGGLYLERLNDAPRAIEVWNEYLRRFPEGRNAGAARQLIAQARARATGPVPGLSTNALPVKTPPPAAPPDATEARLMELVKRKP